MSYFQLIINNVIKVVKALRGFSVALKARSEKRSEVTPLSANADSNGSKPADTRNPD